MASERNSKNRNQQNMYDECRRLMNYHTLLTTSDGNMFDGIIVDVDADCVIVMIGEDVISPDGETVPNGQRQFGGRRRFRRFRRRNFPLASLIALSLLPYPYYPYPYYPYYPY